MRITRRLAAALLALTLAFLPLAANIPAKADVSPASGSTTFTFTNSGITASAEDEESFTIDGTKLKILAAGTYVLKGSCSNGKVTVKKWTTGVTIVLNGLDLTCTETSPILCNKGSEVTISAASGTTNRLADTSYNNDDVHPENTNAENAVIKAKDGSRLTLSGSGTLNIVANGKNGIKGGMDLAAEGDSPASSASMTIKQLTLNVTANVNDAIKSEQLLNVLSGRITVTAGDNAIRCDRTLNVGQSGSGPTISINSCTEGLSGAVVNIAGGNITVNASSDGVRCSNSELSNYPFACNITGGTLNVNCTDGDGIDSKGSLSITGGNVTAFSSASDENSPLESNTGFTLGGGTVFAMGSAAMAESPTSAQQVYVTFGKIENGNSVLSIPAGSSVKLTNASGSALFTATAPRNAGYVIFSSPSLTDGMQVKLLINGNEIATATASHDAGNNPGVPGTPAPTTAPTAAPTAAPTSAPTNTPAPTAAAETPAPTENAGTPEPTSAPDTEAPVVTDGPVSTVAPELTPDADTTPDDSTAEPSETDTPELTEEPETTASPEESDAPVDTDEPADTDWPEVPAPNKKNTGGKLALIIGGAAVLTGGAVTGGIVLKKKAGKGGK